MSLLKKSIASNQRSPAAKHAKPAACKTALLAKKKNGLK
jgi:hypothetical protein